MAKCTEDTKGCKAVVELQPVPKYLTCRRIGVVLQPVVPGRGRRGRLAAEDGQDAGGLCRACSECRSQRTTESRVVIMTAAFEKGVEAPTLEGLTSLYICENNRGKIFSCERGDLQPENRITHCRRYQLSPGCTWGKLHFQNGCS